MKYKELKELLKKEKEKTERLEAELETLRKAILDLVNKYSTK